MTHKKIKLPFNRELYSKSCRQSKPRPCRKQAFFKAYTLNDDPQPHVLFTFGFSNLKPAPSSVST